MRFSSFSWRLSWSNGRQFAFLICILALAVLLAGPARAVISDASSSAVPTNNSTLLLSDQNQVYNAQPFMYHTRDTEGDLAMREIYFRHRNNLRGDRLPSGPVNLSFDPVPHWLVMDIANQSHQSDWVFDFGLLAEGRTGIAARIIVMDGGRGEVLADSAEPDAKDGIIGHSLRLRLMPGEKMTLVVFVKPSDNGPLVLTPRIVTAGAIMGGDYGTALEQGLINFVLVLMAGAAVFFAGCMLSRRGAGFFPHALYFLTQGAWFWLSLGHVEAPLLGSGVVAGVALASGGLLALAVTQSVVAAQEGDAGESILLYICASFVLLTIILFAFIVPENSALRMAVVAVATALAYIVAAIKAMTVKKDLAPCGQLTGLTWILVLFVNVLPYLAAIGWLPLNTVFLQAPAVAMPVVCVLMVLSGAAYMRAANLGVVREILRQAQRQQAMSKLKATKETADQARLVRVIEREREIMEDLRSREAERTEEMRLSKITADEANRAKSAFLAVVSHEIRTPMTGIMGMVRLLQDTQLSREQKDYVQTVQDSGDAMLALLNDILDFSKIESHGMTLESIDFDLHRVVASVQMLMNGHATQRGIYLHVVYDEDAPRFLKGDPTRLRQVFLNMVGNAIKFTQRGGVTIRIKAGDPASVPAEREDDLPVICAVEDTGIGISEEGQKNLFAPFAQADSSIARKFGGTGLGLAICKRLIEAMGSRIQLHSVEGQGTTFSFELVLPPGDEARAQADHGRGDIGTGPALARAMDVLVVDDNAINRKVMEGLLSRDGHRVIAAASGREALDTLERNAFDLVLLDIEMPEMNGFDVMREVLASLDARVRATPVVALTGNVADEDRARYREAGMRDTLAKPIDPERLRNILLAHGQPAQAKAEAPRPVAPPVALFELSASELDEDSFSGSVEFARPAVSDLPVVQEDLAIEARPDAPALEIADGEMEVFGVAAEVPVAEETPAAPVEDEAPGLDDETLFNVPALTSLRQSLGDAQLREMMDGVFAHNRVVLPTLQTAFNEGDIDTLRGCAHELKGMNGNFGLRAVADAAALIEKACREGNITSDAMDDLIIADLPQLMAQSERAFTAGS